MALRIPQKFTSKTTLYFGMAGGKRLYVSKRDLLAWCAGFFDGEGYVGVHSDGTGKGKYLSACVTQKDRRLLERFVRILGFGKIGKPRKTGSKCSVAYYTNAQDVLKLYEHLAPYLGPQKEEQFLAAFDKWLKHKKVRGRVKI